VEDPILSIDVSAQCASYSRQALLYGGFFDSRFRGYGHEHVEHTRRLVRAGYGGMHAEVAGEIRPIFRLLKSCIQVTSPPSFSNQPDLDRNLILCRELLADES
jgi:hypothetical protein